MRFPIRAFLGLVTFLVCLSALLWSAPSARAQAPTPDALYQQAQAALEAENYAQAIALLQQAVARDAKKVEYQTTLADAHFYRAQKLEKLYHFDEAIREYQAAYEIDKIHRRRDAAIDLNNIGGAYDSLSQYEKALEYYTQALPMYREVKDRKGEATTLSNLMGVLKAQKQPSLAIFYGKQSMNVYQAIRRDIRGLDQVSRNAFLKGNEDTYQTLARLLIGEGRFAEAEDVLRMVQQEEFLEFVRRDARGFKMVESGIDPVGEEIPAVAEQDQRLQSVASLSAEEWQLSGLDNPTTAQTARLAEVRKQLAEERQKLNAFWAALPGRFARNAEDVQRDRHLLSAMQPLLAEMGRETGGGVAHISTFVDDNGLELLLTGSSGPTVHLSYAPDAAMLKGEAFPAWLNARIFEFVQAIERRAPVDDKATALWNIVGCRGALERELKDRGVKTVMWRLTGPLRALPLAALRDGDGFLVEKYRQVVLTAGSSDANLAHEPQRDWKALGLGVTGERTVEDLVFPALAGVVPELRAVVNAPQDGFTGGVLPGHVLSDGRFTANAFFRALRGATPDAPSPWQVVHIASHFKLAGDNLKSFLLTGDGKLTMADLQQRAQDNPLFPGVELMTLSACQTAAGGGKGADSLGALAELNGAKSVLATLWPVADKETAQLMGEFYRLHQQNPDADKAVALQQAQLELLKSGDEAAHPYFWAPFVLMGNWR